MAADLEFRIGAELSEIKGALAGLQRDLSNVGQAANKAGGSNAFQGLERSSGSALASVGRMVAGLLSVAAVLKTIAAADAIDTLNARLKLVTSSTEEFVRAQEALFQLSQRTRTSLAETTELYSKIAGATKEAGVGQETLLQVVETINQAVQLSGASAQAAEAALMQLGQGLASGTLRGEELNSILEQTPALADAIAKGMGITRGELRKYGEDGKITAEQVVNALQAQREEVAKSFAELPLTVGQAVTQLANAGQRLLGAFNEASGATAGLASVISDLADFLSSDAVIGAVIEFGAVWSNTFGLILDDAREAVRIMSDATGDIGQYAGDIVGFIGRAFLELPLNIRTVLQIITVEAAAAFDRIVARARFVREAFNAIFTSDTIEAAEKRFNDRLSVINQAARETTDAALNEREQALAQAKRARIEAEARRKSGQQASNRTGRGTFKATPGADKGQAKAAEQLRKAELDAQDKLAEDSAQRQLRTLEQQFDDSLVAAAAYFQRREEIELASIDRAIASERQRAAAGGAERVKALAEIELLERRKTDVQLQAARDRANFLREIDKQLEAARIQELENKGQTAEAARLRLEAQYADLLKRLEAEGNAAGVNLIKGLINTGAAKAQFDQLKAEFDRVVTELQARTQAISDQQITGGLAPDTAQQQTSTARAEAIAQLDVLNQKMQELAASTNDPAIVQGAQNVAAALRQMAIDSATGVDAAVINLRASLQNMQEGFAQAATGAGVDALTGLFTDLASGTKSAGDALKDFVVGFVQSMAQIAARALATYLVLQLLDAIYPGMGKMVAAGSGAVSAGVKHTGGMVGSGMTRNVNPMLFAGAPRYHSGGMVGLKPDERPAILQTGEEVLSRTDPRNQANGGGAGGGNGTRIINVIDPSLVSDYMSSSAGEKTVLNILQRNSGAVRQVLT